MLPFFVLEMTPKIGAPSVQLFGEADFVAWQRPQAAVARHRRGRKRSA